MDLGAVGLDGLVGSDTATGFGIPLASDPEAKHKWYGSGFLKQERSGATEDDWRSSKLAKTHHHDHGADISASKPMLFHHMNNTSLLRSNAPQMLSFSSQKSEPLVLDKASPNASFPYSLHHLSSYNRNTGFNSGNMHGILAGARGPFTPSQWMELEHQALIYKYITANVPVPSHLLIPIKKALESAGFYNFSPCLLRTNNAMGWGGFHLGFSNSTDPEPGRCRRTDGKKWRCSRDAVVDQKYCERHMNRGRHRSRKPVEGQSGHALTGTTTTTTSKLVPTNNLVVPGTTTAPSFAQHQPKNMHPLASDTSAAPPNINRMIMNNKENGSERIIPVSDALADLKPKENPFVVQKQQIPYEESSRSEFGVVTSDSLLNPSQKSPTLLSTRIFGSSHSASNNQESDSQHSLRQFMDDWPKTQSNRSWQELDMQSDRTELSISIPMTSSDFMSSTSSPTNDKVTLSPLRLSRDNNGGNDQWSSPTGILQKTAFGSLSNSSAGSSPRAENKTQEGASLCNDLLGSTLGNPSSLPKL
uniref:Growth-regulating factor n=1 Tax=Cajanus cajan TaxID=3821 RepID=A0A151TTR0_CAJCA|nr:hypothetical protein KK1_009594 [Cajanus cajan]